MHITTHLNYRMAVSVGSEFMAYEGFTEVYHGQRITKAAIYAVTHRVMEHGKNTTYRR